jgi:4-amino-4-deoxy-L-arabinose transferase-like glycosyltransferase
MDRRYILGGLALLVLASVLLLVILPSGLARQIPSFLLFWIWPAFAWALYFSGTFLERFSLGAGLAMFLVGLLGLLLSFLPGEITPRLAIIGGAVLALIPILLSSLKSTSNITISVSLPKWIPILLVLILATFLRLANLDYKEIQGDEGIIMARAAAVISGDDTELFLHQKGPMEILLPAIGWIATEAVNDFWLRLPFAWAGIITVSGVFILTRRWFGQSAGLISSLLFAIGGFGIAFSRIVQYQSLVMLWGILAVICADRYQKDSRLGDLLLAVVFTSGALLAHYDALLIVPALAWLILKGWNIEAKKRFKEIILVGVIGFILLSLFYIPFILSPNFAHTFGYLVGDRLGLGSGSGAYSGMGAIRGWQMITFYNSTWYVVGLFILAIAGMVSLVLKRRQFAAILYFAVPILFYGLVVEDPRTHLYTVFIPSTVLAGYGAREIWLNIQLRQSKPLESVMLAFAIIWLLIVTLYPIYLFVEVDPERQRTWEENRPLPWLYWTTWSEPPDFGLFGFPHQAGWRAAHELVRSDEELLYISNEEEEITNWYMSQASRTHCADFMTYIEATNTQDTIPVPDKWKSELNLQSTVTVNGNPSLNIYTKLPTEEVSIINVNNSDFWVTPVDLLPGIPEDLTRLDVTLDHQAEMIGYQLNSTDAFPGGQLILTIYWRALVPFERNNQVFSHLYDGVIRAQHDGAPECGINPTTRWEPGQIVPDTHVINLPQNTPTGKIPLLVGMYDLITGKRLQVDQSGQDHVYITDVEVKDQ